MASFRDILIVFRPSAETADNDAALSTPPYGEDAGLRDGDSKSGDGDGE